MPALNFKHKLKAGKHATTTILHDKNSIFQSDRPNPGDNAATGPPNSIDRLCLELDFFALSD